jgi:hypothetical protein
MNLLRSPRLENWTGIERLLDVVSLQMKYQQTAPRFKT